MGDVPPQSRRVEPSSVEEIYYDRQKRVPGWGPDGQKTLLDSSILVVGVGGLGCPALTYLARSGIGRLAFADPDRVELSNLPRQTLFTFHDVGSPKVEAAEEALRKANPWITLVPLAFRVDEANVRSLVEEYDLVIDGTDNFRTKFLLHDACFTASKPLISASLHQWEAQIQTFDFSRHRTGCWRCLYREQPEDGCVGVCADTGVAGAVAGLAGSQQALSAIRVLLGLPGPEHCSTQIYDAFEVSPRTLRWKKDDTCPLCSQPLSWDWLGAKTMSLEKNWHEIKPEERQIIVDVREPWEILSEQTRFFEEAGSQVVFYPWSQWAEAQPDWNPQKSYLIVCAHGFRSFSALKVAAQNSQLRLLSLKGGVAELP